jgi:hypothetical protein
MPRIACFLYPELRRLADDDRQRALRRARCAPLDVVELLGIAASLIVAMLVVRYALPAQAPSAMRAATLAGVCAITVGPFLLRRTRRALRSLP